MPYDLKELAAISGQSGLFRLVRPARHGVLVESLDAKGTRSLAPASNKVSLLTEIGIYTQDSDETVPLTEVFERIHQRYGAELPVTGKSGEAELTSFMGEVLPEYDRNRVYQSDIKKLATWYGIVSKNVPYQAAAADEPAADEPLSTGGVIGETDPSPTDAGNPEVTR
ncbi:DUF5606 domain-containing protein [Hymenobacter sp. RP-2-7]|uniref:DUF5606 domain-containing protein n=1 Tax=Hymenobacter polaris TaxID=2682546 RepID=A0A7Y0AAT0_9BACT|nr:DUF5606 domain-containing protein [Hymenobacter polaris]NML63941.1 DUF5606 domain-containing protein [Hymenobacter polaris]